MLKCSLLSMKMMTMCDKCVLSPAKGPKNPKYAYIKIRKCFYVTAVICFQWTVSHRTLLGFRKIMFFSSHSVNSKYCYFSFVTSSVGQFCFCCDTLLWLLL